MVLQERIIVLKLRRLLDGLQQLVRWERTAKRTVDATGIPTPTAERIFRQICFCNEDQRKTQ